MRKLIFLLILFSANVVMGQPGDPIDGPNDNSRYIIMMIAAVVVGIILVVVRKMGGRKVFNQP